MSQVDAPHQGKAALWGKRADYFLGYGFLLPVILILGLSLDCGPWDARGLTCSSPLLEPIGQFVSGILMLMAVFGGMLLYIPMVLVAYVISTWLKFRAWRAGTLRKRSFGFVVWFLITAGWGLFFLALVALGVLMNLFDTES